MARATRKHVTSSTEPAPDAGSARPEGQVLHTHEVAGSSPAPPTTKFRDNQDVSRHLPVQDLSLGRATVAKLQPITACATYSQVLPTPGKYAAAGSDTARAIVSGRLFLIQLASLPVEIRVALSGRRTDWPENEDVDCLRPVAGRPLTALI